ncbi:probable binding protein component of ABC sugar transporter [Candidatus Moduliflexus flocculans]|uniref:Probable binding protein component of ABC sugar transporter n=1 Tax=Candidatus Moduliflexus flocculans TaxID=1499966 RepID=A0A0S6VSF2_9BACT|nr:probable binding protein component of ABC sugar transporter [Candidatus Moduliflexus flocculans]
MMKRIIGMALLAGLFAVSMMSGATPAMAADDPNGLLVYINWSSNAEIGAVNQIKTRFVERGGIWSDFTIAHDTGASVALINMITGGNPPDVFILANQRERREYLKRGLINDFTEYYKTMNIDDKLPKAVKDAVAVDGIVTSAPLAVHIDATLFYNKQVAADCGIDPTVWKSLDDMFNDFDKIKAKGYIPLAIGGQKWQIGYLFHAMAAHVSGELYDSVWSYQPKREALSSPEMRELLAVMRRIQQNTDEGSPNRNWNDTTNLVITGKALMQIHGDWMKGEFIAAGKKIGEDYDSMIVPGSKGVVVTIDEWSFLAPKTEAKAKAQNLLFDVVYDKDTQIAFSSIKGCTPARLDAAEGVDKHAKMVLDILKDPTFQHANPHIGSDEDWNNAIWDIVDVYWNTPNMSADEAIKQLEAQYDLIFE